MVEPFFISKALDITPRALGKSTFSTLKGLLVIGAIAGLGWAIYAGIIRPITKPNPSTKQEAETIQNIEYHYEEKELLFLGIKLWRMRLGVSIK